MLEKAYLPPRRGIYRLYDLRDWLERKMYRTYHVRTVMKVVWTVTFVALAVLYAARAQADTPATLKEATCTLFSDLGVSDTSVLGARDALMTKAHMTVEQSMETILDSVVSACPSHLPALEEWAKAPFGTYPPSKVFHGYNKLPAQQVPQLTGTIA